jgi:1,4-dihydroxy-6-naphthoate synthase
MTHVIRVAHSPDSDDAFMFWALAHHKVDTEGLIFEHHLDDIQTLNEAAKEGRYELTAISYFAYPFLQDQYAILSCGSSIGDKYGPVVISKSPLSKADLGGKVIAIPGEMTTAYLALKIWYPEAKTQVVPFDQIMERVEQGEFEAGLIIHEGQLTYQQEGFYKVVDLGEWWFEETNLTLPLGGNAIRKDLGPELMQKIARILKASIACGLAHREEALAYAKQFGRDLPDSLVDRFVGMYVNDMTLDMDLEIQKAIKLLLYRGHGIGLIPFKPELEIISVNTQAVLSS